MKNIFLLFAFGLIVLAACSSQNETPVVPANPSPSATAIKILPTPSSAGDSIVWDDLQVRMGQLEITQEYLTDFGSTRVPPEGNKFLWVQIHLKNTGQTEMDVPHWEHFSILYAAIELKPIYGHRAGYTDYTAFGPVIFPDQELDGWLRFDIPIAAELSELRFVFLPESSQVGTSYGAPSYPYSQGKPTYVWKCAP